MKLINELGNHFGKLKVVDSKTIKGRKKWVCKCSCGNNKEILRRGHELRSNTSKKHCGCESIKKRDKIVGMTFGKLKVIEFSHKDKTRRNIFKCKCTCGKEKLASSRNLRRGATTHCGCSKKFTYKLPKGQSTRNSIIDSYKTNASNRNLEFLLTTEECEEFFKNNCFYCDKPPSKKDFKKHYGYYYANGIDRKDNSKGYFKNNCVSCCTNCNYTKSNQDYIDFLNWLEIVYLNLKNKREL